MYPPVFATFDADPNVRQALRANGITRLFPFGEAPQGVEAPYAVWQVIGGSPGNYLGSRPSHDRYGVQMDVYARTGSEAAQIAEYLRDAVELVAHITAWRIHGRDEPTGLFRVGFDISWHVLRPPYTLRPDFQQIAPDYGVYRRQFDITMNERWADA